MKNAVITGADGGMGCEITKAVAMAGYHVIMACKDPVKGQTKKDQILSEHGWLSLEVMQIDLASLETVSSFADKLIGNNIPISLLMNNAGTLCTCFEQTADGLERTVSVNYVGPYLLTRKLLPLMSEGSRIVNMVSCTYSIGKVDLPKFFTHGSVGNFWRIPIYSNTKLALLLFTFELSEQLRDKGISVNAADPGIVSTDIIRMRKWFDPLADIFFRPFIRKPKKGASTAIDLLLKEEFNGVSGKLCVSNKVRELTDKYYNHPLKKILWDQTEKIAAQYLQK